MLRSIGRHGGQSVANMFVFSSKLKNGSLAGGASKGLIMTRRGLFHVLLNFQV